MLELWNNHGYLEEVSFAPNLISLLRVKVDINLIPREKQELDDAMHDFLMNIDAGYARFNTPEETETLKAAGYDTDPEHWAIVKCVYLPFLHFIYLPENWMI